MICINCGKDRFGGTLIGADFYCPICIAPMVAKALSPTELQDKITQLQRDNEALRKELNKIRDDAFSDTKTCGELSCEECNDRVAFLRKQLAAAEAKCERLKSCLVNIVDSCADVSSQELISKGVGRVAGEFSGRDVIEVRQLLSESPSTSLTNYTREQTNEVKEALVKVVKWLVSYTDIIEENPLLDDVVLPALAKLKQIRNEE